MKQLYLHIGYPKTGTTSLQRFFSLNEEKFLKNKIVYPRTGRIGDAHYGVSFSLGLGNYDRSSLDPDRLKSELIEEIKNRPWEKIIISSEYFITARQPDDIKRYYESFRNLIGDFEIFIIVYLRRHDGIFESGFTQSEKTSLSPPWDPDINSYTLHAICSSDVPYDYLQTLHRWQNTFGKTNLLVRPLEKKQNIPDLYGDFLKTIQCEDDNYFRPVNQNQSIDWGTVLALRFARKLSLDKPTTNYVCSELIKEGARLQSNEKYFSPAMRLAIIKKYLPSYFQIARNFIPRKDGILFEESLPKLNDEWEPPLTPSKSKISERIIQILANRN
ncbi:hypothetical protein [Acidocella sp.]|uniref:hypothetical protein n=1 Tax=Acidocella sp. TaxID=50710 RepID=UPI00260BC041|nr:hypothetical protein [Acidocella sp.]